MAALKIYSVGMEIESMCSKCKDATVHMIEVIKNDIPTRVLCKSCHSSHRYRAPETAAVATTVTRKKVSAKSTGLKKTAAKTAVTRTRKTVSTKTPEQRKWSRLCNKFNIENPKEYVMNEKFLEHDAIQHKKFGLGVVVEILDPNKMSVAFEEGIKTLVHNR